MNKRNKGLENKKRFLSRRIKHIQKRQDELMLRDLLLSSIKEDLEHKLATIKLLIVNSQNEHLTSKQVITFQKNHLDLPTELYMN